ncbi:MAG: glycosyltransferase [Balneolaceae bacterium]|nr:glycosyltransferase [Balneolaceae bacterium]
MKKVLHYKTNFLNKSETFIDRLIRNHDRYQPVALCYRKKKFTENLTIFEVPRSGFQSWVNFAAFHANLPLPYYTRILKQERPQIVHAHFGYDAVKLIKPTHNCNIPLLVSFYGTDVSRLPSEFGWKSRYRKLAEKAAHFIAASGFMKNQLIDLGFPQQKISIVRFGLDLNGTCFDDQPPLEHKIMMVGRMVEKKGFEYGLRAIAKLRDRDLKPEVNIYGYGPEMERLKKMSANLGLNDQINFLGYQPIEKIFEAHHEHTIMLAPSTTADDGDMEGLPNTILEAMAQGTTVVATNHAAIPEVIEDKKTGFLVDERDPDSLARAVEKIIRGDFDLQSIRQNARHEIEKSYGVGRMVREVETIYDKVAN